MQHHDPTSRILAQTPIEQASFPSLFVPIAVASELPLRHAKQLAGLRHRKIAAIPTAQNVPKLLHSPAADPATQLPQPLPNGRGSVGIAAPTCQATRLPPSSKDRR
ncbi:hypothetical protein, partial [Mesorhizobium sp. B264B1A]